MMEGALGDQEGKGSFDSYRRSPDNGGKKGPTEDCSVRAWVGGSSMQCVGRRARHTGRS